VKAMRQFVCPRLHPESMLCNSVFFVVSFLVVDVGRCHQSRQEPNNIIKNAADFLLDAKLQADQMDGLKKQILALIPRVNAGGQKSRCVHACCFQIFLARSSGMPWHTFLH